LKILVVDDEIVALNALKKRVDWMKYGFTEVLTAMDAASAREILKDHTIDLVLCDIEMPGESGLSLVEFIRSTYPWTECMMVTCHADFDYLKKSMKCRVWDYLLKPIDYEELDGILTQFVEEIQARNNKERIERIAEKTALDKGHVLQTSEERVTVAKQYIEEHLNEKIYVEELADLIHINEQHFMRIFKKETGQSVTEYITERRILLASDLLKTSDYSINFISDCIGCENYSYFSKLFKRYTGFTPKEYRQQFKK